MVSIAFGKLDATEFRGSKWIHDIAYEKLDRSPWIYSKPLCDKWQALSPQGTTSLTVEPCLGLGCPQPHQFLLYDSIFAFNPLNLLCWAPRGWEGAGGIRQTTLNSPLCFLYSLPHAVCYSLECRPCTPGEHRVGNPPGVSLPWTSNSQICPNIGHDINFPKRLSNFSYVVLLESSRSVEK